MRVLGVASVLLAATLFFVWAKRRIGPGWALLPAVLLMFYGSAWQHVVGPIGFTVTFSVALGLGALIAIERGGRRGDLLACGLLALSVFTYTVGLAYLVGVAITRAAPPRPVPPGLDLPGPAAALCRLVDLGPAVRPGPDRVRRLRRHRQVLRRLDGRQRERHQRRRHPLSRIFDSNPAPDASPTVAGWLVALALTGFLIWRVLRGNVPRSFWASLGVLFTFWLAAAIADTDPFFGTQVYAIRYLFPGTSALLLVLVDAASGLRIRAGWAYGLLAVFAFSLAMNIVFLRDGAAYLRDSSAEIKGDLAMLELANGWLPGGGPGRWRRRGPLRARGRDPVHRPEFRSGSVPEGRRRIRLARRRPR